MPFPGGLGKRRIRTRVRCVNKKELFSSGYCGTIYKNRRIRRFLRMEQPNQFRASFNGFNREDVVRYMEYINSKHAAQVAQLTNELEYLRGKQETLDADRVSQLEKDLGTAQTENESLKEQNEALNGKNETLTQQNAEAKEENERLKARIAELEQK